MQSSDPTSSQCQRCTRLDIPCVYQAHQRGRKRKDSSSHPLRHASSTPTGTHLSPLQPPKKKRHDSPESAVRQVTFSDQARRQRTSNVRDYDNSRSASPVGREGFANTSDSDDRVQELHQPPANSVYHDVADRSIFSIAGVMERSSATKEGGSLSAGASEDDPVRLGLLSMDECDSLFGHYFDQLQTCVCLLDPTIHTAAYTRRRSLQLFVAVLTVACKFFRPEMYETMLSLANNLVNQAIAECVAAIELVQAICILHYWKKPTDGRGWLRLGHAIRLGYQLDLHLPRKRRLPSDEREARLAIDRERTWISLFCFDSTMTQLSDRPSMMHKSPDVEPWIRDLPYPLPSDGQLEFAVKTSLLSSEVRQLQSCGGSYEVLRSGLRRILEDLHRSHQALSSDDARVKLTSTSVSINKFSTLAVQLLVECTSLSFAPTKHRISLLHRCVSTSLDLLDIVVDAFARKGIMPMIEDAHSVAVASTAVRLIRFMSYLDTPARASVLRKLTRGRSHLNCELMTVVIVCREAARGEQESHPAYLARFIHALLDKAHQSRQASRESSPAAKQIPGMTPIAHPGVPSPAQQKTTPDQWWENIVSGSVSLLTAGPIRVSRTIAAVRGAPDVLGYFPTTRGSNEHALTAQSGTSTRRRSTSESCRTVGFCRPALGRSMGRRLPGYSAEPSHELRLRATGTPHTETVAVSVYYASSISISLSPGSKSCKHLVAGRDTSRCSWTLHTYRARGQALLDDSGHVIAAHESGSEVSCETVAGASSVLERIVELGSGAVQDFSVDVDNENACSAKGTGKADCRELVQTSQTVDDRQCLCSFFRQSVDKWYVFCRLAIESLDDVSRLPLVHKQPVDRLPWESLEDGG